MPAAADQVPSRQQRQPGHLHTLLETLILADTMVEELSQVLGSPSTMALLVALAAVLLVLGATRGAVLEQRHCVL